jgi:hypothetical protein
MKIILLASAYESISKKTANVRTYNITLKRVRATIVAMEKR